MKVDAMNGVAGQKMSLACVIGFRQQESCPGRLISIIQVPGRRINAKVHVCHTLCTALLTLKDIFGFNLKEMPLLTAKERGCCATVSDSVGFKSFRKQVYALDT